MENKHFDNTVIIVKICYDDKNVFQLPNSLLLECTLSHEKRGGFYIRYYERFIYNVRLNIK